MQYEASLVHHGEPLLTRQSADQQQLVAWVLSHLECHDYSDAVGVIRNQLDTHAPIRVYTCNPHFG